MEQLNLQEIKQLLEIAERHGLEELTVSEGQFSVTIRAEEVHAAAPVHGTGPETALGVPARSRIPSPRAKEPADPGKDRSSAAPLVSPMTGVFYRAPAPEAPPFVEVGDQLAVGQTIGIIEAMKVFSEVPAETAGRVVEIVAANGVLVQADEPLMYVEPVEVSEVDE